MDNWILLVLGLILIFIPISYKLEYQLKWRGKINEDFKKARGTIHRKIIEKSLLNLNREISSIEDRLKKLSKQKAGILRAKEIELETTLTARIVNTELTAISGIGDVLKDRIITECFDGTLESLNSAGNIHGIGSEKARAINQWVRHTKARLPPLLLEDFPEKPEITKKYTDLDDTVVKEINTENMELQSLQQLKDKASEALNRLKTVSRSTFYKAYKGDAESADKVTQYLTGVYPEWGKIPTWLETLMEKQSEA